MRYLVSFILWTRSLPEACARCGPDSCPFSPAGHLSLAWALPSIPPWGFSDFLDPLLCLPHFMFSPFSVSSLVVDHIFWNFPNKLYSREDFGVILYLSNGTFVFSWQSGWVWNSCLDICEPQRRKACALSSGCWWDGEKPQAFWCLTPCQADFSFSLGLLVLLLIFSVLKFRETVPCWGGSLFIYCAEIHVGTFRLENLVIFRNSLEVSIDLPPSSFIPSLWHSHRCGLTGPMAALALLPLFSRSIFSTSLSHLLLTFSLYFLTTLFLLLVVLWMLLFCWNLWFQYRVFSHRSPRGLNLWFFLHFEAPLII